jgi:plastocyanin
MTIRLSARRIPRVATIASALAVAWLSLGAAAPVASQSVVVRGTVVGKGLKTNQWMVVSLEAPGLALKPPTAPVHMDQKSFRFVPHVLPIVVGTTVRFLNNDPEGHNVYSPEGRYNLGTWPAGETRDHKFDKAGVYTQLCNVHPDMLAFIVVLETPYFAVSDATGQFEIPNVAPGKYKLVVWSEKLDGLEQDVTVAPGKMLKLDLVVER